MRASSRTRVSLLLCGFSLWAGMAAASDRAPSAMQCFEPAFKAGDAEAVSACYAEDAIMWFPGGPMAKGRAAIRDGFAHYFGAVTVRHLELAAIGQETLGTTRVSWGTYVIRTADKATGVESTSRGRFTDVSRKIDGRWLYIVDHPSDDPAQPAAE